MPVAYSGTALSVAANSDSADLATGTYQFVSRGVLTIYAKPSVTGMKITVKVGGIPIVDRMAISNFGATGSLDMGANSPNKIDEVLVNGGRVEMFLTNTTGGAITCDYMVKFQPTK